jgi:peptide/nickel transport system substrate-binding protein
MDWEAVLMDLGRGADLHNGSNIWLTDAQSHHFNRKPSAESRRNWKGRMVSEWEKKIEDLYVTGSQEMDEVKRKLIYNVVSTEIAQEQVPFIYLVNAESWLRLAIGLKGFKPI